MRLSVSFKLAIVQVLVFDWITDSSKVISTLKEKEGVNNPCHIVVDLYSKILIVQCSLGKFLIYHILGAPLLGFA